MVMEASSENRAFEVIGCAHLEDTVCSASSPCPRAHPCGINVKRWLNIYEGKGQHQTPERTTGYRWVSSCLIEAQEHTNGCPPLLMKNLDQEGKTNRKKKQPEMS